MEKLKPKELRRGHNISLFKEGFYNGVYFHNGEPQKELSLNDKIALYGVAEQDINTARKLAEYLHIDHYPEETLQPHFHNSRLQLEMIRDKKMRKKP